MPTVREGGIDFSTNVWVFVIGPKGIPETVQARLNKEFLAALDDAEVRDRLSGFGLQVPERTDNTPAALKRHIDDFAATYGKLIADMGIKPE